MPKAVWQGTVIAESEDTVVVDGNHYFPETAVKREHLEPSDTHTVCGWKGTASYYHVTAGGNRNTDAAWFYPDRKPEALSLKGRIAFWRGVQVE